MRTVATATRPAPQPGHVRRVRGWTARGTGVLPLVLGPLAIFAFIIGTWQAGVWNHVFGLASFTLPRPSDIVRGFRDYRTELQSNFWTTFKPALVGYVIGNAVGLLAGALLVLVPTVVARRLSGVFTAVQALPIIALAPLVALYLGSGFSFKTAVVAVLTFPSMMVYSYRGMTHVTDDVFALMESYEAGPRHVFLKVRLPNALPFAFTALKYTVLLAVVGVVVSEILRARTGLGYEIEDALQAFDTAEGWAAATLLALLGVVWYSAVGIIERILVPWAAAQRNR